MIGEIGTRFVLIDLVAAQWLSLLHTLINGSRSSIST